MKVHETTYHHWKIYLERLLLRSSLVQSVGVEVGVEGGAYVYVRRCCYGERFCIYLSSSFNLAETMFCKVPVTLCWQNKYALERSMRKYWDKPHTWYRLLSRTTVPCFLWSFKNVGLLIELFASACQIVHLILTYSDTLLIGSMKMHLQERPTCWINFILVLTSIRISNVQSDA